MIAPRRFPCTAQLALDARDVERLDELATARPESELSTRAEAVRAAIDNLASLIRDEPEAWTSDYLDTFATPFGYDRELRFGIAITREQHADLTLIARKMGPSCGLGEALAIAVRLLCDAYDCPR